MRKNWAIALAMAASLSSAAATAGDAYDAMLERWQAKLTGPATLDRQAPDVVAQLRVQADTARDALARMKREPGASALWDDLADFANPKVIMASAVVVSNASRLLAMAQAYGTPGGPLYKDAALGQGIAYGLDWLVREHYHAGKQQYGNWWSWQIGAPQHLLNVLSLAGGALPPELRQRTLAAVNWFVPDARYKTRPDGSLDKNHLETAANLLDKAQVVILSGMLGKDGKQIAAGRDAIGPALQYVTAGDGFYRDGSFIQHGHVPYAGNYGVVALQVYGRLLHLLNGSEWAITDPNVANVYTWARVSFADLLVDGAMPDAMRGRKVAMHNQGDHSVGRGAVAGLASIAEVAPADVQAQLRSIIKGTMQRDRTFGASYLSAAGGAGTSGMPLYELGLLKAIQGDPAIQAAPPASGPRLYPSMDRAFLRGKGFTGVLAMASPRVSAFTTGNGENVRGWWQGMGMLYLYDAHQEQFGQDFWATVDARRLPGTTSDDSGKARLPDWTRTPNPETWVGGASLGQHAALGMVFSMRDVTGSDLRGRKSWFMLGEDRILAMGSGISGGQGSVETIVENRRLADPAGAKLLVDGVPMANGKTASAHWAYLQDDKAGSRIGYVFPAATALKTERGERQGSWRDIHEDGPVQVRQNTFQLLSIAHGSPQYAYLLLPASSEAATRAAAAKPGIRIESNNDAAAAVSVPAQGVYAANLWQAGSAPRGGQAYAWASAPAALIVSHRGKRLQLAVAEPTQGGAVLEVSVREAAAQAGKLAPGVTVLELAPVLRLRIDTTAAAGATFEAEFTLK
ncbi:polysaccharide lyase 8 family protein [Pseudoduganella sp. OTU4001]|uniref:polysaccharide lyase 8 family protein n=1 Tax=Pseudoduganella sp. OTU4001 TaxID=3043854 RepID=UPI00313CDC51